MRVAAFVSIAILMLVLFDQDTFSNLVSIALIGALFVNMAADLLLRMAVSFAEPDVPVSLRSRVTDADELLIASLIGCLLGLNRLFVWGVDQRIILGGLAFALLLVSAPAVDWLWIWRREVMAAILGWRSVASKTLRPPDP